MIFGIVLMIAVILAGMFAAIIEPQVNGNEGLGLGSALRVAGAPSAGTNEVQTLTIGGTPTGGTFTIAFDGFVSGAITWSATNATLLANINAALDAMANVGTGGLVAAAGSLTSGIGTITLTAGGNLAKLALPLATIGTNSLTGTSPTLAIAETTPGVTATARGCAKGAIVTDTTNGKAYINTGTPLVPVWTVVGAQS